jgi:hypothetical protein
MRGYIFATVCAVTFFARLGVAQVKQDDPIAPMTSQDAAQLIEKLYRAETNDAFKDELLQSIEGLGPTAVPVIKRESCCG